jgi:hypothetical protein
MQLQLSCVTIALIHSRLSTFPESSATVILGSNPDTIGWHRSRCDLAGILLQARSLVSYQNNTLAIAARAQRVLFALVVLTYDTFPGVATACRRKEGQGQSQSQQRRG